jgi:hypothetical protein
MYDGSEVQGGELKTYIHIESIENERIEEGCG